MTPDPRCPCGKPVAFTVEVRYSWGVEYRKHVCATCAPLPSECASWAEFGSTARETHAMRDEVAS